MKAAEVIGVAVAVAVLCLGFSFAVSQTREFKQACKDRGGEAVHNGRHWECIK